MIVIVLAMAVVLGLTAWVFGLTVLGVRGRGEGKVPGLVARFGEAARHFNGEAEPPEAVQRFAERHLVRSHRS